MDEDKAYLFYFVHPVVAKKDAKPSVQTRRTSLQVNTDPLSFRELLYGCCLELPCVPGCFPGFVLSLSFLALITKVAELGFDGRWLTCDRDKYFRGGGKSGNDGGGRLGGGARAAAAPEEEEAATEGGGASSLAAEVLQAAAAKKAVAHAAAKRGGGHRGASAARGAEPSAVAASWWSASAESPFKSSG